MAAQQILAARAVKECLVVFVGSILPLRSLLSEVFNDFCEIVPIDELVAPELPLESEYQYGDPNRGKWIHERSHEWSLEKEGSHQ